MNIEMELSKIIIDEGVAADKLNRRLMNLAIDIYMQGYKDGSKYSLDVHNGDIAEEDILTEADVRKHVEKFKQTLELDYD